MLEEISKFKEVLKRYGLEIDSFGGINFLCEEGQNGRVASVNSGQRIIFIEKNKIYFLSKKPKKTSSLEDNSVTLGDILRSLKWTICEDEKIWMGRMY